MKPILFALAFCATLLGAPSDANDTRANRGFLIDPSKHYVYLKFDHIGDRKPLSPVEPRKGLWLRLVNNCRIPIAIAIFSTENPEPDHGIAVYDEVISRPTTKNLPLFHFPGPGKDQPKPALQVEQEPPEGYSLPDVFSTTAIPPADNLLLNLPVNHVSPSWYLQVRFYFALPGEGYGVGPYSVVSFDWWDIPEKFREQEPARVSPKPMTH